MVAHWDSSKRAFAPAPSVEDSQEPQGRRLVPRTEPVKRALPGGKGTYIDLQGSFQSYTVIKALGDGGQAIQCEPETRIRP